MKKALMRGGVALLGLLWGALSYGWLLFSLALAFVTSRPGSFEYEYEDKSMIPLGWLGLGMYAAFLAVIVWRLHKGRKLALFLLPALLALCALVLWTVAGA